MKKTDPRFLGESGVELFNGNELLIKGALETVGGVHLLTGYPGSPVAGFFDVIEDNAQLFVEKGIHAAIANNEALAIAAVNGSQMGPIRAMAAFKSDDLAGLRSAAATMTAILNVEMPLHIAYCSEWGLSEADMAAETEALETIAYTRFVLDRGVSGDLLDLQAALAPCVVGYAEAVEALLEAPGTRRDGHPYAAWIDSYSSEAYRSVAAAAIAALNRAGAARGGADRFDTLSQTFTTATKLEAAFWDMALAAPNDAGR